jgi:alkylation response protein AidB-like acyl-CoA dehydrogenase
VFFGFDDDQLAFRDAVSDLLAKHCPPAAVRVAAESPAGELDRGAWDRLAEMGVLATLVPTDADGLGLDERSLVLVLEEAGCAGLPHPLVDTAAVAAPLVATTGDEQPGPGPAGAPDAHGLGMVATDLGGPLVACAADADWLLLHDAIALARDRGAWGTAALLVGLGQRMLDMTVAHVREREQFGVPVGSFQAVKHHLADALKELAFARPAVQRAAHSLATGAPDQARDVSMAKAMASDAARFAGRQALQCHGAIGYTVEHDLHLYLKRTWALAAAWGDPAWHRDRVGAAIGV